MLYELEKRLLSGDRNAELDTVDIFGGLEVGPTTQEYLDRYNEQIQRLSQVYNIPAESLEYVIRWEFSSNNPTGKPQGVLGIGEATEQRIKAFINRQRPLLGDYGDMTMDGNHHLGNSYGLLSIKPGLLTKAVIEKIDPSATFEYKGKRYKLRDTLFSTCKEDLHHAHDKLVAYLASDFGTSLELAAANMSIWWPVLQEYLADKPHGYEIGSDEYWCVVAMANGSYPYDNNRLYDLLPHDIIPDLKD